MTFAVMVPFPSAADVVRYVGGPEADPELLRLAETHVEAVRRLAASYTRGSGFDVTTKTCGEDLAAAIVAAAARFVSNPEQDKRLQTGDYSVVPTVGWSLVEQAVLNRYRRRAT